MPPGFLSSQHWGLPLPGADPPWDAGKCSWEVTTEDLPFDSPSLRLRHGLPLDAISLGLWLLKMSFCEMWILTASSKPLEIL